LHYTLDIQNGTTVENRGTLITDGAISGQHLRCKPGYKRYNTAFVGNRTGADDAFINTNFTAAELGLSGDNCTAWPGFYWDGTSGGSINDFFGMNTTGTHATGHP
jgi:hypothetical protein